MKQSINEKIKSYKEILKKRKKLKIITSICSVFIVVTVIYLFVTPAFTAEKELICQIVEHTHSETCYEKKLICTEQFQEETVTETQQEGTEATTSEETTPVHEHTESCYESVLICQQEEHTHTDSCYKVIEEQEPTNTEEETTTEDTTEQANEPVAQSEPIEGEFVDGGSLNDNETVNWKITKDDEGNQTLTIYGTGKMPDFSSASDQPWKLYRENIQYLYIEDNITYIGNYNFRGIRSKYSLKIGLSVEEIGIEAFSYCANLNEINIPENVQIINNKAFYSSGNLKIVTLNEGLVDIGEDAFSYSAIQSLKIPKSVKKIQDQKLRLLKAYCVEIGNTVYSSEDGILYENLNDGTYKLIKCPAQIEEPKYTIKNDVTILGTRAFSDVKGITFLHIPNSVKLIDSYCFNNTGIKNIYIEDGVEVKEYMLFSSTAIESVRYPKNLTKLDWTFFNCSSLEEIEISENINYIGNNLFGNCSSLKKIFYDAKNCNSIISVFNNVSSNDIELTVGSSVDNLITNFFKFSERAKIIKFVGENDYINIDTDAFKNAIEPLEGLSGEFYVDEQGVLYQLNTTDNTAKVVYASPTDTKNLTIPKTITSQEQPFTVTEVGSYAFMCANGVERVAFDAPEKIINVEDYAFADCSTLQYVNDKNTIEEATKSFTNESKSFGKWVFEGTALKSSSGENETDFSNMDGLKKLAVYNGTDHINIEITNDLSNTEEIKWISNSDEKGGYELLTGVPLNLVVSMSNKKPDDNRGYRVYFDMRGSQGSLGLEPGQKYTFTGGLEAECKSSTESPRIIYLEFSNEDLAGDTFSFGINPVFPTPYSKGGTLKIWGQAYLLDNENVQEELNPQDSIQAKWITKRDGFALTKKITSTNPIELVGDGTGNVLPKEDLAYTISLKRESDTTSDYGKDYVRYVEYTDTPVLPDGVNWSEEVMKAFEEKSLSVRGQYIYAADKKISYIEFNIGEINQCREFQASLNETGIPTFTWKVQNTSSKQEIPVNNITFKIMKEALHVDTTEFNKDSKLVNTTEAILYYTYSGKSDPIKGTDEASFKIAEPTLSLSKTSNTIQYFGEDIDYKITLKNTGASSYEQEGNHIITDNITSGSNIYLRIDNLEKMFAEANYGDLLTITMNNAELGTWEEVTDVDNNPAWKHIANSDSLDNQQEGQTLTIKKVDTKYVVTHGAEKYYGSSPEEALRKSGFAPTSLTTYKIEWNLTENNKFELVGGETKEFHVYATAKDTFKTGNEDWPNEYPNDKLLTLDNKVRLVGPDGEIIGKEISSTPLLKVKREAIINKKVSKNGTDLGDSIDAENGDILDYTLNFRHYGDGVYEDLPMVDDLYGSQYLLVPYEQNKDNPSILNQSNQVEKYPSENPEYFILKEGHYEDIKVGYEENTLYNAATITVTKDSGNVVVDGEGKKYNGIHTQIKWYFSKLEEESNYQLKITYKSIVDTSTVTEGSYSLGNIVWMNDKTGNRIYDGLWGGGTIIDFNKEIVTKNSDETYTPDEDDHSVIAQGDSVTYRLTLFNKGDSEYTLKGSDIADELPNNKKIFDWVNGTNVSINAVKENDSDSTIISNINDEWSIENKYGGLAEETGQQYIVWNDNASITFNNRSKVFIYVTLKFPSNTEDEPIWDQYCDSVQGSNLMNTFLVYNYRSNVTHNLQEKGEVLLQKGVYNTAYQPDSATANYTETSSRTEYSNKDRSTRFVTYYVLLYNNENTRLYLNPLQDQLPDGFTFTSLITDPDSVFKKKSGGKDYPSVKKLVTSASDGGFIDKTESMDTVKYLSATIDAEVNDDKLQFKVSEGGENSVHYDEKRNQYYLDKDEAIVFGYFCNTGKSDISPDYATNVIGMSYEDYLGSGTEWIQDNDISFTGKITDNLTGTNDGAGRCGTNQDAQNYGFTTDDEHTQWLFSDVTVKKGSISPGVYKKTVAYSNDSGTGKHDYVSAVSPTDTVYWSVTYRNDGTNSINNYEIYDIMPNPYTFVGSVTYQIYDEYGNKVFNVPLTFTISSHGIDDSTLIINNKTVSYDQDTKLQANFDSSLTYIVNFSKENEKEKMTIKFENPRWCIPEGGYAVLEVSSKNETTNWSNKVYTNQAGIYPTQEFDGTNQGSIIKDDEGKHIGVKSTSLVNVSSGFATNSEKKVMEMGYTDNSATSNGVTNTILLNKAENEFRYTLVVNNDTNKNMNKLTLIDSLPDIGDHSPFDKEALRDSEYKVVLADNVVPQVTVFDGNGGSSTVSSSYYKFEYSSKTEFNESDWDGSSEWSNNPVGARSIRITITDDLNTLIPPKSRIEVSFTAKAETNENGKVIGEPGSVAWNSFGYRYTLDEVDLALEAMPLNVGVKLPTVPHLKKELVGIGGKDPAYAEENQTFKILIHKGEALSEYTEEALIKFLDETRNSGLTIGELKISTGENKSDILVMKDTNLIRYSLKTNWYVEENQKWKWEEGETYTAVEVEIPENYEFYRFENGVPKVTTHTFKYQPDKQETIVAINTYTKWNIDVLKVDEKDNSKKLQGAVFALYTPSKKESMSDEVYDTLPIQPDKEKAIEGTTYYLKNVKETNANGGITFSDLTQEQYALVEVKAPDGYDLDPTPKLIYRSNATTDESGTNIVKITIKNHSGFELPETGGSGTTGYTLIGISLMLTAIGLYKRRKEDGFSK